MASECVQADSSEPERRTPHIYTTDMDSESMPRQKADAPYNFSGTFGGPKKQEPEIENTFDSSELDRMLELVGQTT